MAVRIPKLIIVIPCYNEEATLPVSSPLFAEELVGMIASGKVSEESRILLVDDGSTDDTWKAISDLANVDSHFIGIRQSRNRGIPLDRYRGKAGRLGRGRDRCTAGCAGQSV